MHLKDVNFEKFLKQNKVWEIAIVDGELKVIGDKKGVGVVGYPFIRSVEIKKFVDSTDGKPTKDSTAVSTEYKILDIGIDLIPLRYSNELHGFICVLGDSYVGD